MSGIINLAASSLVPVMNLIVKGLMEASGLVRTASKESVSALHEEVAKQEILLQFEMKQAKVAQELAIAQRISEAETVEIEEFYDISGQLKAGLQSDLNSIHAGLSTGTSRVTKRIYTFKGINPAADKASHKITD
ncbi:MAG: hypothetical protein ABF446_00035 [Acetobacter orientalis]